MKKGFTLAEVLVTLGIIGIVAALTIPSLMKNWQELQYKSAYKKAYSDLNAAFQTALQEQALTPRTVTTHSAATASEWTVIKNTFKISKDCIPSELYSCWVDADKVCPGCGGYPGLPEIGVSASFVDASGRVWSQYSSSENIYLVDTNGFDAPNRFGKDRWMFTMRNADGTRTTTGLPSKVGFFSGVGSKADEDNIVGGPWCQYPPCYYNSWLFK